mgnify:CR=1 FL=1
MSARRMPRETDPMGWLQDFADCLAGEGALSADEADEWMQENADIPTDGTSWTYWRDYRLARQQEL